MAGAVVAGGLSGVVPPAAAAWSAAVPPAGPATPALLPEDLLPEDLLPEALLPEGLLPDGVSGEALFPPEGGLRLPVPELLPPAPATAVGGYRPSEAPDCRSGRLSCVRAVVDEMRARLRRHTATCHHDAVFALTYLRTTERYLEVAATGDFFTDTSFVNHQDVAFAEAYFDAWDRWRAGRRGAVPEAWAIAFAAADDQRVSGIGNLLLGMSAHVNHDLPLVLAQIGLVKPDGTSRKVDHDRVNRFLQPLISPLLAEVAARYDPSADDASLGGTTLDDTAVFQLLALWREQAWRNAERLAAAPTPVARERVAATIAAEAALIARVIEAATSYGPGRDGPAARNAFCAAQR